MSNSLAIATVTSALQKTIRTAIETNGGMPTYTLRTERPHYPPPEGAGVFVFLFRVTPNASFRNAEAGGAMALNLHYLISFFGDESILEPQRLMGIVVGALHTNPILSRASVEEVVAGEGFLMRSDLAGGEAPPIRLTPLDLSTEEMTRIWGAYFGPPYILSIGYDAGPVFISGNEPAGSGIVVKKIRVVPEGE